MILANLIWLHKVLFVVGVALQAVDASETANLNSHEYRCCVVHEVNPALRPLRNNFGTAFAYFLTSDLIRVQLIRRATAHSSQETQTNAQIFGDIYQAVSNYSGIQVNQGSFKLIHESL